MFSRELQQAELGHINLSLGDVLLTARYMKVYRQVILFQKKALRRQY